jgi:hypothetical protein
MSARREAPLRCPSAQSGMEDALVLGVVAGSDNAPRVEYLNEYVPATQDVLDMAAPVSPGEVFRLAAHCESSKCTHFDGERCQLAVRIVAMLPEVAEQLPPCIIRPDCRWYRQEGRAACVRCPQIVTMNVTPGEDIRAVAQPNHSSGGDG